MFMDWQQVFEDLEMRLQGKIKLIKNLWKYSLTLIYLERFNKQG